MNHLRIVTRNSNLALVQCDEVATLLPQVVVELLPILSLGDRDKTTSLMGQVPADFFTRELDEALLCGQADIAVHSAKDLPYPLHDGLEVVALLPAANQSDSLVSRFDVPLAQLPEGASVGTSSKKRAEQLAALRPDLKISHIRGTIEERIAQVDNGSVDALIVATCALDRLGLRHRASEELPFETHPLQGHLAVVAKRGNKELSELFEEFDVRKKWGEVIIAGFGPGDPGLITRRAEAFLAWADYIVYDDLIDTSILGRYCAHKIYVGKRKGAHYSQQDEINRIMHQHAVSGKRVVRLKGGDPLVFGRGAEEFHYLSERLVKASIIPGISSALAAAASAVVPLTARGVSSSVVFLSGHDLVKLQVPKADTLVFFMGASNQRELALKLVHEGWSPSTPVAIVKDASKQSEEKRRYTLQTLSVDENPLGSPSIIIVGHSAGIRGHETPKRWLFTGLHVSDFKEEGICVHSPMIAIEPLPMNPQIKAELEAIGSYDRIVFTSRYAVQHFFDRLMELGLDARSLSLVKITSIGETTSKALRDKGILAPPELAEDSSHGLVQWFATQALAPERILIPRSALGLSVLPDGLTGLGHKVTALPVYNTVMPDNIIRHNLDEFDGVVFTSPSTVDNFIRFYGQVPQHLKVLTRGRETLKRVGECSGA